LASISHPVILDVITLEFEDVFMPNRLRSYRLRTLFVLITAAGLVLGFYIHAVRCGHRSYLKYCDSIDFAFRAIAIHTQESAAKGTNLSSKMSYSYEEWSPTLSMDRATLHKTVQLWEDSINSTSEKEYHWSLRHCPWVFATTEPKKFELPQLPDQSDDLQLWWNENIKSYIESNFLHHNVTATLHAGANIDIFNSRPTARVHTARFFGLDDLLP